MSGFGVLWSEGVRSWLRAKGLWIVLVAALVPPILTGSWALTHQDDVAPALLVLEPQDLERGDLLNVTAIVANRWNHPAGPFNATVEVGYFEVTRSGVLFRTAASDTFRVPRLAAEATHQMHMNWTAQAGTFVVRLLVDVHDEVAELEENNNDLFQQFTVRIPVPEQSPPAPEGLNGTLGGEAVDLAVVDLRWDPEEVFLQDHVNVTVTVANRGATAAENATVLFAVGASLSAAEPRYATAPVRGREMVSLAPNATAEVRFPWQAPAINWFALAGAIQPPSNFSEAAPGDNILNGDVFVDRRFIYEPPEERATAKAFYRNVLEVLHVRFLLPLIALFYAGTILDEERRRGGLDALLTRPVPRWLLPLVRSLQGFLVTAGAVAIGVVVTFALLLGLPQQAPGFLLWPLMLTLLCLFAYGGLFTLLGVWVERPYLWGLAYVLGVESAIVAGKNVLINNQPILEGGDWVVKASLAHWMERVLQGWDASAGQWSGGSANNALAVVAAIGILGLAASAWWMTRREFPS